MLELELGTRLQKISSRISVLDFHANGSFRGITLVIHA
jgi:hypothetical protein